MTIILDPNKPGRLGVEKDDGTIAWSAEGAEVLDEGGNTFPPDDVMLRVALGKISSKPLWKVATPWEAARLRDSLEKSERLKPLIEALRIGGSVADMTDGPTVELHVAEVEALLTLALAHQRVVEGRRKQDRVPDSHLAFLAFLAALPAEEKATLKSLHDLRSIAGYRHHEKAIPRRQTRSRLLQDFLSSGA